MKLQSCPLQNTTPEYLKISVEVSFYHKEQRFFRTSWNNSDICAIFAITTPRSTRSVAKERCHCLCWRFWMVSREKSPLLKERGTKKGHYFVFFRWKTWLKGSTTWLPWKTLRRKAVDRFSFNSSYFFGAKKYEFHQSWGFLYYNIYSLVHRKDLNLAGHKLCVRGFLWQ